MVVDGITINIAVHNKILVFHRVGTVVTIVGTGTQAN